jgi:hypothetical protein
MSAEQNEVIVRDVELDEPFFLPEDQAKIQEGLGKVVIVKEEKPEPIDYSKRIT